MDLKQKINELPLIHPSARNFRFERAGDGSGDFVAYIDTDSGKFEAQADSPEAAVDAVAEKMRTEANISAQAVADQNARHTAAVLAASMGRVTPEVVKAAGDPTDKPIEYDADGQPIQPPAAPIAPSQRDANF